MRAEVCPFTSRRGYSAWRGWGAEAYSGGIRPARRAVDICVSIYDAVSISALDGQPLDLEHFKGKATLIVNVASRCGLTPQYAGLEQLQERFAPSGFSVLGVPCNQFGGQEPGSPEQIAEFCSTNYGVSFPMTEKVDVNGAARHPLYQRLVTSADAQGKPGDIQWNFEKFLVSPAGDVIARFRPQTEPLSAEVVSAIESALPFHP